jgi:hypothetical protein
LTAAIPDIFLGFLRDFRSLSSKSPLRQLQGNLLKKSLWFKKRNPMVFPVTVKKSGFFQPLNNDFKCRGER